MKKTTLASIILLLISTIVFAQRPTKIPVGHSGCQAYFMCNVPEIGVSYSEDSSVVYTGDCMGKDSLNFGIICIRLKEKIPNVEQSEEMMIQYMDYLKRVSDITGSAGYGKGHTLNDYPDARGVIDFWTDRNKREWKVKGWTDGNFIAVMYVISLKGSLPNDGRIDIFLNGFRFPGMK